MLAAEHAVCELQIRSVPATGRARRAGRLPARGEHSPASVPCGFGEQVPPELGKAHLPLCFAESMRRLLAVATAFLLAAHSPVQSLELLQSTLEGPGIGKNGAIRAGRERLEAQVYAHSRAHVERHRSFLLHLDRDGPMPRLFTDGGREHLDARSRHIAV